MYKQLTADDFRKSLGFEEGYRVEAFICQGKEWPERAILAARETLSDSKIFSKVRFETNNYLRRGFSVLVNKKRVWFSVEYGSCHLSEVCHIACLLGSKVNIQIGGCGVLNSEVPYNSLLVAEFAYSTDCPTRMYCPEVQNNRIPGDKQLIDKAVKYIAKKCSVYLGTILDVQCALAEDWEFVKKSSEAGFDGIDMETATLYAVSRYFKVPAVSILTAGDNLIRQETVLSDTYRRREGDRQKIRSLRNEVAFILATRTL